MAEIFLVTGGARSGKSTFAEKLALKLGEGKAAYIATAQIFDSEMAYRVNLHKKRRGANWLTFESPFNADKSISLAAKNFNAILFDCVTMYLSNFLCNEDLDDEKIFLKFEKLLRLKSQLRKLFLFQMKSAAELYLKINLQGFSATLQGLPIKKLPRSLKKFF